MVGKPEVEISFTDDIVPVENAARLVDADCHAYLFRCSASDHIAYSASPTNVNSISLYRVAWAFSIEMSLPLGGIEIEAGVKDIFRLAPSCRVHRSDLTQFAEEPGASYGPFALDGSRRDSHGVGGFFDGQSSKESELNDTALLVVDFGEIGECVVEPD